MLSMLNHSINTVDDVYFIDEAKLSAFIAAKDWEACWDYLCLLMRPINDDKQIATDFLNDFSTDHGVKRVHNFAALISKIYLALILNDEITISDESFYRIMCYHELVHSLLYIVGMENTDQQLDTFLEQYDRKSKAHQKKFCLLVSLNTRKNILDLLKSVSSKYRAAAVITFLNNRKNYLSNHHRNKKQLTKVPTYVDGLELVSANINQLANAYFGVSYIDDDDKHKIKYSLNKIIRRYNKTFDKATKLQLSKLQIPSDEDVANRKKPLLLVCLETFSKDHAMYRSFGKKIMTLHKYFDVHIMIPEDCVDDIVKQEHPNCYVIKYGELDNMFAHIKSLRPDMVLFPSVGMRINNIMLSNEHLSDFQIMSLGHPATTMSQNIDAIFGPEYLYEERSFPNEKYIIDSSEIKHQKVTFMETYQPKRPSNTSPKKSVHIAVAGALFKLTDNFADLLEEIRDEADFEIKFTFLLNPLGPTAVATKIYFLKKFPDCRVFGFQPYKDYFEHLQEADIVLNAFPFGHSNTLIDTLIAGKPSVSLDGTEPHSRSIGALLKRLELENKFLTTSIKDYKKKFFDYAEQIMGGKRDFFDPQDVYNKIYNSTATDNIIDYGAHLKWVYKHRHEIKNAKDFPINPANELIKENEHV